MTTLQTPCVLQADLFDLDRTRPAKPFLKWAGGKTRLLRVLRTFIPENLKAKYCEPFLGGGALFFDLAPSHAILSDSNPELISCYEVVRDNPDDLIDELSQYHVKESEFYRVRSLNPDVLGPVARAARFIYLNKTCYNGLYRVNKRGQFNTPFGHYKRVSLVDEANLRRASRLLKNVILRCQDYQSILKSASKGDFVYLDPPYMPASKYSDFKRYTKESFYQADHEQLAEIFNALHKKGCFVLLSNSCQPTVVELYKLHFRTKVQVPRFVNCKGEGRGDVTELLISNYPIRKINVA